MLLLGSGRRVRREKHGNVSRYGRRRHVIVHAVHDRLVIGHRFELAPIISIVHLIDRADVIYLRKDRLLVIELPRVLLLRRVELHLFHQLLDFVPIDFHGVIDAIDLEQLRVLHCQEQLVDARDGNRLLWLFLV